MKRVLGKLSTQLGSDQESQRDFTLTADSAGLSGVSHQDGLSGKLGESSSSNANSMRQLAGALLKEFGRF